MKDAYDFTDLVDWVNTGWKTPGKPLTEADMVAANPPRHGALCYCVLCDMDRQIVESARATLFGDRNE